MRRGPVAVFYGRQPLLTKCSGHRTLIGCRPLHKPPAFSGRLPMLMVPDRNVTDHFTGPGTAPPGTSRWSPGLRRLLPKGAAGPSHSPGPLPPLGAPWAAYLLALKPRAAARWGVAHARVRPVGQEQAWPSQLLRAAAEACGQPVLFCSEVASGPEEVLRERRAGIRSVVWGEQVCDL